MNDRKRDVGIESWNLQKLSDKVEYEGGLAEFLINYGNALSFKDCGSAVFESAKKAQAAFNVFEEEWNRLLDNFEIKRANQ